MLTEMRKVTRGWIAMGVIGLLALAFAIWGIHDVFKPVQSNEAASGRGVSIPARDFDLAFNNELKNVQAEAHRTVTKQEAVAANFHMQVLDRLITQRVFDRLAGKIGVSSSDAMVAQRIQSNPAFRNAVTGSFDANTYKTLLAQNGISRELYESDLRSGMTRTQLAQSLVAGLRAPSGFGRMIMAFDTEKRTTTIAAITSGLVPAPPAPTEAELAAFYKAQSAAFALPEYRSFTVIRAEPAAFESRVEVPEDKIVKLFDYRKGQMTTPEKRTFVVLGGGKDQATAQQAATRLAAGEAPDAIARALGMQAITLTQKSKADAPDPRIGEAVFKLKAGETTPPIQGITWSVAKVSEIIPGVTPSLDEARPQLRAELAREEAVSLMNDAVEKFEDARSGGADLDAAATAAGLAVTKAGPIDARGLNEEHQPDASVLDQPELLKAVFAAGEGDPSDWISQEDGGSFMVRIDKLKPTGAPPLAQIRDKVATAWRYQKIGEGMARIVDAVAKAVKGGQSFSEAARAHNLQIVGGGPQTLDRRAAQQGLSPQLGGAVFAAREGEVVSGIGGPHNDVMFVARVDKIAHADPSADPGGVEQRRQAIEGALGNDTLATVQAAARQDAHIRINQPLVDRIVGKTDAADNAN